MARYMRSGTSGLDEQREAGQVDPIQCLSKAGDGGDRGTATPDGIGRSEVRIFAEAGSPIQCQEESVLSLRQIIPCCSIELLIRRVREFLRDQPWMPGTTGRNRTTAKRKFTRTSGVDNIRTRRGDQSRDVDGLESDPLVCTGEHLLVERGSLQQRFRSCSSRHPGVGGGNSWSKCSRCFELLTAHRSFSVHARSADQRHDRTGPLCATRLDL